MPTLMRGGTRMPMEQFWRASAVLDLTRLTTPELRILLRHQEYPEGDFALGIAVLIAERAGA